MSIGVWDGCSCWLGSRSYGLDQRIGESLKGVTGDDFEAPGLEVRVAWGVLSEG